MMDVDQIKSMDVAGDLFNFADYLSEAARSHPNKRAVIVPSGKDRLGRISYSHLTFEQLDRESDKIAEGFRELGIVKGTKTLVMVKPSLDFLAILYALMKLGAVFILIDPGMGVKRLLECIKGVKAEAFIAIPKAHVVRLLYRKYFDSIRINVLVGKKGLLPAHHFDKLRSRPWRSFTKAATQKTDLAAILFTTGSTGPAKGVEYQHGMFAAGREMFITSMGLDHGEIDMPVLPFFSLYTTAVGMTACVPDMDPTKPAQVDPEKILECIENHGVTFSFGSPALWSVMANYCIDRGITLPTLKRVLMGGAPIHGELLQRLKRVIPNGEIYTPYGATECLPISNISASEILGETFSLTKLGHGICLGRGFDRMKIKIVKIVDQAIERLDDSLECATNEIGEIIVSGPVTTRSYHQLDHKTKMSKITDHGEVWHRMDDAGYLDDYGRLWFCGRLGHRVITPSVTLYSVPCEAIFDQHRNVFRSALVGVSVPAGRKPVIVIEPKPGHFPESLQAQERFIEELRTLGAALPLTRDIVDVLFHRSFPVDIRHNAKIFREELAVWAQKQIV